MPNSTNEGKIQSTDSHSCKIPVSNSNKMHNPYKTAGFLSIGTFSFATPMINTVFSRGYLEPSDIYSTTQDLDTQICAEQIECEWNKKMETGIKPNILNILLIVIQSLLALGDVIGRLVKCGLIFKLLTAIADHKTKEAFVFASFLVFLMGSMTLNHNSYTYRSQRLGTKIRTSLMTLIYKRMLNLRISSNISRGEIISLITNDSQKFDTFVLHGISIFMPIVEFILMIIFYFNFFHYASKNFILAIGTILIPFSVQFIAAVMGGRMKKKLIPVKDEGCKQMTDVIAGIQVLKYFHWETPFFNFILRYRRKCEKMLNSCNLFKGTIMGLFFSASFLCISVYKLIKKKTTSAEIYAISSFLDIFGYSFCCGLPKAIEAFLEVKNASIRISSFLIKAVKSTENILVEIKDINTVLSVRNASLSWNHSNENESLCLLEKNSMRIPVKSSTFEIKRRDFCMIMGPVGSGKSALLYSILGELHLIGGEIIHSGKIAFVPQSPWIIAGTIRENILFGREFDQSFYSKVIKTACLELDMKNFENGDLTVVSDNGTTLSGGQRSRISLARALYSKEAELFLLDDVLSAVDNKVGKAIFKGLVNFFEGKKTCLFISHQLQFAKYCSKIMLLKKGSIKYFGTYENLIQNKGIEFVNELITCHSEKKETNTDCSMADSVKEYSNQEYSTKDAIAENDTIFKPQKYSLLKFINGGNTVVWTVIVFVIFMTAQVLYVFHGRLLNVELTKETTLIFIILIILTPILFVLRAIFTLNIMLSSASHLFFNAFNRLLKTNYLFFLENAQGTIINRLSKDQSLIDETLPCSFLDLCQFLLTIIMIAIICIYAENRICFFIPIVLASCLYYRRKFIFTSKELKKIESTSRSPCYSLFISTISGLSSIRCFKNEKLFLDRFVKYQNFNTSAMHGFIFCSRWFALRIDMCSIIFFAGFVFILIFDLKNNFRTAEENNMIGFALTKCSSLMGLLQWTLRVISEIQTLLTSVDRVEEYTKLPMEELPEVTEKCKKVSDSWPEKGHVSFQNVSLKYPNSTKLVLCGITVELLPSQKIAVVGRTGAGKTSLISAIFRILEPLPADSLKIDNESISAISLGVLRSRIAIIPQEPFLFKGTIRFNLDPFEQFTDEKLWDAIRRAEMQDAVCEMPDQLDSEVQEGGSNFSVGERQLLCLARAILRRPKVIIMDEATANIDILTTEKIIKAMATSFSEATVITIVHRLHTIMEYDRVMVLEKGVIAEFDSPFNLLSDNQSNFSSMVQELGDDAINQMREVARLSDQRKRILK